MPRPTVANPRVHPASVRIGTGTVIGLWLGHHVLSGLWWLLRRPAVWLLALSGVTGWYLFTGVGVWAPLAVVAGVLVCLTVWRFVHVDSFRPAVGWRLRAWWRRVVVYQRLWQPAMVGCQLAKTREGEELLPEIVRVSSTDTVDRVEVKVLPGQTLQDFGKVADRLAATFEAVDCRVRSIPRSAREVRKARKAGCEPLMSTKRLELWFLVRDPLTEPVPAFDVPDEPDMAALPVALREDGQTWSARILGTHVLIAGETGAGKGSVLWSLIRGLCPLIASRTVELHVIDPKGGMELAAGRRLFTSFCYGRSDAPSEDERQAFELSYAEFLEGVVERMHERQDRLMGHTRQHIASPDDPGVIVVVDELAALTAYVVDREAKKRISTALALLLSQGRAVGFYVIAALQDSRKEVLSDRNLFPTRIALRLAEDTEVDQILGNGFRAKGARCDEIPESLPGTAFVKVEGTPEPVRVRFGYVSDTDITTMANLYAPGTTLPQFDSAANSPNVHMIHTDPGTHRDTDEGEAA